METPQSLLCCFSVKAGIGRFRCKLNHICLTQHTSANLRAFPRKRRKPKRMVPEDRRLSVGCSRPGCDLCEGRIYRVRRRSAEASGITPGNEKDDLAGNTREPTRGSREIRGPCRISIFPSFCRHRASIALRPEFPNLREGGRKEGKEIFFQLARGAQKTS